ncbi:hypothetical protein CDL15_Pgr010937 [Punica granatum]|uniref:DRBM domain-containing protein n=2 Tax=Punica granatum TaxID=22663 RepID=A0A218XME0_PUNGR|nr:hypothetical protein CDL15_Pgr010937 [Punica granatum]
MSGQRADFSEFPQPKLPPPAGAQPELPPAAGAQPELPPAAGAQPELPPAAGAKPELPSPAGAKPELPSPAAAQPELPPPAAQPELHPAAASPRVVLDRHAYKNRLQELAHKSSLPTPAYSTVNEGLGHLPRFRATVVVDGKSYTSPRTFLHRKEAEQDVARIAYEILLEKVNNEQLPPVHEDLIFSKSIMNEFATKMHLEMPTYMTRQLEGETPLFESSLIFNSVTYPACVGKNKKEAEQLAARAAIQSLRGKSESEALLAPIIKSKARVYASLNANGSNNNAVPVVEAATHNGGTSMGKDTEALPDDTMLTFVAPRHQFTALPGETSVGLNLPITFVPASSDQQCDGPPSSSRKRRKNKKKASKRARFDGMVAGDVDLFNQAAECLVDVPVKICVYALLYAESTASSSV